MDLDSVNEQGAVDAPPRIAHADGSFHDGRSGINQ